jgi:putative transposase
VFPVNLRPGFLWRRIQNLEIRNSPDLAHPNRRSIIIMPVQLTERVQVRKTPTHSLLCHRVKNLYNLANFYVRQELFHLGNVLTYFDLDFMHRKQQAYYVLPAQTAQQVLQQVAGDWHSYFAASKAYRQNPQKFLGTPRPPRYKPEGGESVAFFTNQQCRITGG